VTWGVVLDVERMSSGEVKLNNLYDAKSKDPEWPKRYLDGKIKGPEFADRLYEKARLLIQSLCDCGLAGGQFNTRQLTE
jgi:hypothetical protein